MSQQWRLGTRLVHEYMYMYVHECSSTMSANTHRIDLHVYVPDCDVYMILP